MAWTWTSILGGLGGATGSYSTGQIIGGAIGNITSTATAAGGAPYTTSVYGSTVATWTTTTTAPWGTVDWLEGQSIVEVYRQQPTISRPQISDEATKKSFSALKRFIGKEKFTLFKESGYIPEKGKYGDYRFFQGSTDLKYITLMGNKKLEVTLGLCVLPQIDLPVGDVIITRIMHLREDEDRFISTCNVTKTEVQSI